MLLTDRLLKELNIHYFVRKGASPQTQDENDVTTEDSAEPAPVQLNKDEFRLLVKMLQAVKHELKADLLRLENNVLTYPMAKKTLVFDDVNKPDTEDQLHLASLKLLLNDPAVKRPVWEKLKTLHS